MLSNRSNNFIFTSSGARVGKGVCVGGILVGVETGDGVVDGKIKVGVLMKLLVSDGEAADWVATTFTSEAQLSIRINRTM